MAECQLLLSVRNFLLIIRDLELEEPYVHEQVAALLLAGFADMSPGAWPTLRQAMEEVKKSFVTGNMSIVAMLGGRAIGWACASRQHNGNSWEIHLLVVHQRQRMSGVGTALVAEIESRVIEHGGLTLWVGIDDQTGLTSIWGQDLYPDPLKSLSQIRNLQNHPYEFYEKLGFSICGVLPDANGLGKPDIFLAKRVRKIS